MNNALRLTNRIIQVIGLCLASLFLGSSAQEQPSRKTPAAQNHTSDTRVFGQAYTTLRPEQKDLVNDLSGESTT